MYFHLPLRWKAINRHPDSGRGLPVHPTEIPLPGQVPVAVQFHCRTLVRRERGGPVVTPGVGPWSFLRWLLLVADADVRRRRRQHRLDAGVGRGDGDRKEHALGEAAQQTHGHSPDWQWAGYRGRIALLDLVTYQSAEGEFWYGPD